MNSKAWLTVFGVVAAVVLGGSGFYAFSSYGKYAAAMEGWDAKVGTIEGLERRVPYPNEKNAEAIAASLETYKASVQSLSETLKSFQRPLNKELANTDFQQQVKKRVEEFRAVAKTGGLEIDSTTEFQLGFDSYANTLPTPELVPVLDYELEATDHLLRKLVECGAETLAGFQRDAIPGETGGAEKHDSGVVHKYPVRFRFKGSTEAFQKFVNALANDKEFFYVLRVLKVKSDGTEGAIKLVADATSVDTAKYQNPATKEIAGAALLTEWGAGTATESEVEAKAKAAGFVKSDLDARVLMGQEKLSVFVVVDITRFLGPEEVAAAEPKPEPKKGGKQR